MKREKIIEILEEAKEYDVPFGITADAIMESVEEKVPNLSGITASEKHKFVIDFVEMTAKNVLSVFVALGLKTHLEATVINDADGNKYKLSFRNINHSKSNG